MDQLGIKLQQELAKAQVTVAFQVRPSRAHKLQAAPAAQWKQLQPLWSVTFNTSSTAIACSAFHVRVYLNSVAPLNRLGAQP